MDATRIYFISVVNDKQLYDKLFLQNIFIKNNPNISLHSLDNTRDNLPVPVLYNQFLDEYDFTQEAWFVFCHNDWEIQEDLGAKLSGLDKKAIYGPIGARLRQKRTGEYIVEYYGECRIKQRDGSQEKIMKTRMNRAGLQVDSVDAQCLLIHSSLFSQGGPRFDEKLTFDLYAEDFSLTARLRYGIPTRIVPVACCHWSPIQALAERKSYLALLPYMDEKYPGQVIAGCCSLIGGGRHIDCRVYWPDVAPLDRYHTDFDMADENNSHTYIVRQMEPGSRVLDIGCAGGTLGKALKKYRNCRVWGIERERDSRQAALDTGAYQEVFDYDLDTVRDTEIASLRAGFDSVVLGDVLEHVYDPKALLRKGASFLRPGGGMFASIPNIAHASIKLNLLRDNWIYQNTGLLDKTHIRFFTYKSIAGLLADAGLIIAGVKHVFVDKQGDFPTAPWRDLPRAALLAVYRNPHSFVYQYAVKMVPTDEYASVTELEEVNLQRIGFPSWDDVPAVIREAMLAEAVNPAAGPDVPC